MLFHTKLAFPSPSGRHISVYLSRYDSECQVLPNGEESFKQVLDFLSNPADNQTNGTNPMTSLVEVCVIDKSVSRVYIESTFGTDIFSDYFL